MFAQLRRLRWLAFTLALAVPGLGGSVLQALHPCEVDAPWLASHHGGRHGSSSDNQHGAPDHGAPADAPATSQCHCISSCASSASGAAPAQLPTAVLQIGFAAPAPVRAAVLRAPAEPVSHRLPPATAPPAAA
jgi:hypothetical protein